MRLCDRHFGELLRELSARRLAPYALKSQVEVSRVFNEVTEKPVSLERFDATLYAYSRLLDFSIAALQEDEDGPDRHARYAAIYHSAICPVCSFGSDADDWIVRAARTTEAVQDASIAGHA